MSLASFKKDQIFGNSGEKEIEEGLKKEGWTVEPTSECSILDFIIKDNKGNIINIELKTRRCNKEDYPDTMIGINKLIEAYKKYNESGQLTVFIFKYLNGIYYINPFIYSPIRFEWKQGRWDRGGFDKKKGWIYYDVNNLTLVFKK